MAHTLEQGGLTMPQELTKLLSERYCNSFHFRPEAQQMKTYPLVNRMASVSFLVINRPQVTGAQFRCPIKTAHYNCLLSMTI